MKLTPLLFFLAGQGANTGTSHVQRLNVYPSTRTSSHLTARLSGFMFLIGDGYLVELFITRNVQIRYRSEATVALFNTARGEARRIEVIRACAGWTKTQRRQCNRYVRHVWVCTRRDDGGIVEGVERRRCRHWEKTSVDDFFPTVCRFSHCVFLGARESSLHIYTAG